MTNWRTKYTIESKLGEGGQAEIFRVRNDGGREYALKQLLDPNDREAQARMQREVRVLTSITHEHVMPLEDHDTDQFLWLVMPVGRTQLKLDGEPDLYGYGRALRQLTDEELLTLVRQAARGLHAAHSAGFVHRDIKPSNIVLLRQEPTAWVVADWGTVRNPLGQTTVVRTTSSIGTQAFASPEQWRDGHRVDFRADYYGLGRVVAAARCAQPLVQNLPELPEGGWRRFVRETTRVEPSDRPRDFEALWDLIEEAASSFEAPEAGRAQWIADLQRDASDFSAANRLLGSTYSEDDLTTLVLDELPVLDAEAFHTLCAAGDDAELARFGKKWRQRLTASHWGRRDFNHANAVLGAFLRLVRAAQRAQRWGLFQDLLELYFSACADWDRWSHCEQSRIWLNSLLADPAATFVAQALNANPSAKAWYASGGWRPSIRSPLRKVFI